LLALLAKLFIFIDMWPLAYLKTMKLLNNVVYLLFLIAVTLVPNNSYANQDERTEIIVGMGARPPFLDIYGKVGAGPEILQAMNLVQDKFRFKHKIVATKRKQQSFQELWVDISMWDNLNWGWQEFRVEATIPIVEANDIFISKHSPDSGKLFSDLEQQKIVIVNGYHYHFLGYETDVNKINQRFNVIQVRTEEAAIRMVESGRATVAVVSDSSYYWYIKRKNLSNAVFDRAAFVDASYTRHFVVPKSAPITVTELNEILKSAHDKGLLLPIYKRYGLKLPNM